VATTQIAVPNLNGSYQPDDPGETEGAKTARSRQESHDLDNECYNI